MVIRSTRNVNKKIDAICECCQLLLVTNSNVDIQMLVNLLNCVSCLLKTSSRVNMTCVVTCSRVTVSGVLMCLRAKAPWVLNCLCQHDLRTYVLTCQHAMQTHLLTCQHTLSSLPHTACVTTSSPDNMPSCLLSSFDATFSASLPFLLKLYTLLIRFDNLIDVFPQ